MHATRGRALGAVVLIAIFSSCGAEHGRLPSDLAPGIAANAAAADELAWSEPVWLGPVVNSSARDWRPVLSTDGRRLYFHSNRDGGRGGFDIWVSGRAQPNCPWETPMNVGGPLNTARDDGDPAFTPDMRVVFFSSDEGHGGEGRGDILVSRRADPDDDFAWTQPVNLGPQVNTAAHESNPWFVPSEDGGTLYFDRSTGLMGAGGNIYRVRITRSGETDGPAVQVQEASAPGLLGPHAPTVTADGRELIFWSGSATDSRPDSVGQADLWVSTRRSVNDDWSAPRNIGRPVNSIFADLSATLSHDGRTLFFTSAQARGGRGLQDMWMSTRGAPKHGDNGPPCAM